MTPGGSGTQSGWTKGEIRFHKLRHTYPVGRIRTTKHGAPVALFTVARELGHRSTRLTERRYGHELVNRRVRGDDMSFRIEDYVGEEIAEAALAELVATARASLLSVSCYAECDGRIFGPHEKSRHR